MERRWQVLGFVALAFATLGAPVLSATAVGASSRTSASERVSQPRARVAAQQAGVFAESNHTRANQHARADLVDTAGSWTHHPRCRPATGRTVARRLPSSVALRAPERGPPSLPIVG